MPMATSAPMSIIHIGRLDGSLKASSTPVSMAEPSANSGFYFQQEFLNKVLKKYARHNRREGHYQGAYAKEI